MLQTVWNSPPRPLALGPRPFMALGPNFLFDFDVFAVLHLIHGKPHPHRIASFIEADVADGGGHVLGLEGLLDRGEIRGVRLVNGVQQGLRGGIGVLEEGAGV